MNLSGEASEILRTWRTRILNGFLLIAVLVSLPAFLATIANLFGGEPSGWPVAYAFIVIEALLVGLAVGRRLPTPLRVSGLLALAYAAAVASFFSGSYASSGTAYLLVAPFIAVILVGKRGGIAASIVSGVIGAVCALVLAQGWVVPTVKVISTWTLFATFAMLLSAGIVPLLMLYSLQERLIERERATRAELVAAQALLEEQNAGLEQKVRQRTEQMEALVRETEQRSNELAIINSVQAGLASKLEMQAIYDLVGDKIREIFDAQTVILATFDLERDLMYRHYAIENGERLNIPPLPISPIWGHFIREGHTLLINRGLAEMIRRAEPGFTPPAGAMPRSSLSVPLILQGRLGGVISLQDVDQEDAFTDSDSRLLETLANSLSVALENARLFDETQRLLHETEQRNNELAILNRVAQAVTGTLDLKGVTRLVGDQLREIFEADSALIMLLDRQTNLIHVPYEYDRNEGGYIEYVEPFPLGTGLSSRVIETARPLLVGTLEEEIANGAYFPPEIIAQGRGFYSQSWLGVPIIVKGQVLGLIALADARPNAFNAGQVHLLETLSSSVGVAIENARLFQQEQQRAAELATVNTVSAALVGELDLGSLIGLVGEQMRSVFHADIAYVALLDEVSGMVTFPYTHGEPLTPIPFGQGLASKVIASAQAVLIDRELNQQIEEMGATVVGNQALSYLGVPVFMGDQAVGALSVQSTVREGAFTRSDLHLLNTIAANVGIALRNANLFTELKRQKYYAQESQRRLADIINFLPDATLVIDSEGRVIAWNRAIEEMTGVPADEMLAKGDYEYAVPFYGERRPILIDLVRLPDAELEKTYAQIRRDGTVLTGETYTPALKNGARYMYATASALHDSQGNVVGAIETIRDITERKHGEEELRKAKAEADQANQAKSAFLANMSHELRTPLNAIIGFTRIVRRKAEGVLPEKQTENLDKVLVSAEHLLNLINTVLDIAKIEAGRMDVMAANFRIGALIDLCANTAQPLLRPNVLLEKRVDERLNLVFSDQDKIRQIVLNLLSNAAKFTHEGHIVLSARLEADGQLAIAVEDTGIGIADEALPRIFKEFQQADNSTTRQYGGTGLGLSISRNLARLLGGDLTVTSELGKGSIFTLHIPAQFRSQTGPLAGRDIAPVAAATISTVPAAGEVAGPAAPRKRILVIDDDPDAVYLLQENVGTREFDILGARDGREGLRLAQQQQPDAILLDVIMPGADGWQILHALKANPLTAGIPVILLTIVDKKALGYRLGASAYLLKPLDAAAVRAALERVTGGPSGAGRRVLVVDDDPNVADMLRQWLPAAEFTVEAAADGQAGLQAIARQRPDMVLLDIIMPGLDGFGVIDCLHADPATRDLPIIVLSAKDLSPDESSRLKASVRFVMRKQGFEGDKLLEEIRRALDERPRVEGVQA